MNWRVSYHRAGLKPIGITPNWAPRKSVIYSRLVKYIQVQTLVQVDWEPGPTEIVPNWAPHIVRPALLSHYLSGVFDFI